LCLWDEFLPECSLSIEGSPDSLRSVAPLVLEDNATNTTHHPNTLTRPQDADDLASPNKSGTHQADGSSFSEYNRTRASSMMLITTTSLSLIAGALLKGMAFLYTHLCGYASPGLGLITSDEKQRSAKSGLALEARIPLRLPLVELSFISDRAARDDIAWLDECMPRESHQATAGRGR
jgi:hypothetical protein